MMLLNVHDLSIRDLISNITFQIDTGESVGIIGESGSGKTLTALTIMQLIRTHQGEIELNGIALSKLSETELCRIRGKRIAMVFQEPMTALDPLMKVGRQIREAANIHQRLNKRELSDIVRKALEDVELPIEIAQRYPHELSGGQRQRVMIAMALINNPDLLICDEPTTALDVTTQKAVVELILRLTRERNTSLLFISHDLGLIASTCQRILVMRQGQIVEKGSTSSILHSPQHEYTKQLIESAQLAPARGSNHGEVLLNVQGTHRQFGRRAAVKPLSLQVRKGERLGIVGGSGSGKTTLLRMIAGLIEPDGGEIKIHGSTRTVFQDPRSSLDPKMNIAAILKESRADATRNDMERVLNEVGIETAALTKFPHQFSGGQRQRIAIARALIAEPDILLADEPVSALDVTVRAKVLRLLDRLVDDHQMTMVFVSHDLSVVRSVCDTIAVMLDGEIVEYGPTKNMFSTPQHEYTKELLASIPQLD